MAKYFALIRNMRNASEHRKDNQGVDITDFTMRSDGRVYPPIVEVRHAENPIDAVPVIELRLQQPRGVALGPGCMRTPPFNFLWREGQRAVRCLALAT
jgi:hypothetical protein